MGGWEGGGKGLEGNVSNQLVPYQLTMIMGNPSVTLH